MIIPTHEDVTNSRERATIIKKRISDLLCDKSGYEKIVSLMSEPDNEELAIHDQEIYILRIISLTVMREIEDKAQFVLFDGRNIEDLITVYRTMSMYLRRIEFDFPFELQSEILDYILKEHLSIIAIISFIQNNMSIINKDKVINGIRSLLEKMG